MRHKTRKPNPGRREQQGKVDILNATIHSRNLYMNGRRMINARLTEEGLIVLEDLYTELDVPIDETSVLTDGNGVEVVL